MKITLVCTKKKKVRFVLRLGRIVEQTAPVVPTPNFYRPFHFRRILMFSMSDSQQTVLSLTFTDKKGNPTNAPAGVIQWMVDNPALLALTPAPDALSCTVAAVGPLGVGRVSVKVSDPGDNTLAAGSFDVEIDAGAATNITVTPSVPTEQP